MSDLSTYFDVLIIGSGMSGSTIAASLAAKGIRTLVVEAGRHFNCRTYPQKELDGNSQLYWSGGLEASTDFRLTFLRPKVVGGGTIVNQALLDRFDDDAWSSFQKQAKIDYLNTKDMEPYFKEAESYLSIESIPEQYWNNNAKIFAQGFKANNFRFEPLVRAQKNCHFEKGNDCIECLSGCPIDSKQSTPVTTLKKALAAGTQLLPEFEVRQITKLKSGYKILGLYQGCQLREYSCRRLILAAGSIGNAQLLLRSGYKSQLPRLGENFFSHPQYMTFAEYDHDVLAFKGPLQSLKSSDPNFRQQGFKLENVFAPPVSIAMLIPGWGKKHMEEMLGITKLACIEVAIRDVSPGTLTLNAAGNVNICKPWSREDIARRDRGLKAIKAIYKSTGAKRIIHGDFSFGLHLMGGLSLGATKEEGVVNEGFKVHGEEGLYAADSSIFPNAPGINPSFSIMALSLRAGAQIAEDISRAG